jgi:hypothetical protein
VQKAGVPGWDRTESATKSGLGVGALVGAVRANWDVRIISQLCLTRLMLSRVVCHMLLYPKISQQSSL